MANSATFSLTPLHDAVCMLIETPFRNWRECDKKDLLKMGRPQPFVYVHKNKVQDSVPKTRSIPFRRSWYFRYLWLCGSTYTQKLYCWPCLLFGDEQDRWVCDRFNDEDVFQPFELHDSKSEKHKMCTKELAKMEKKFKNPPKVPELLSVSIHSDVDLVSEDEIRMNRSCMQFAIDAVVYMVKHEIPFDIASSSKRKSFADLVTLLFAQTSNQSVLNHLRKLRDNPNPFQSLSVQNGILGSISECVEEHIGLILKDAQFFVLRIDDGPCESTECSAFFRYINNKAEIKEYFLGFYHLGSDRTSLSLFRIIDTILENYKCKPKLVGISYDITCAKFNYLKDLRVGMKFMAQYAIHVNLMSHHLDYMVERFLCSIPTCRTFFAEISTLLSLFLHSTKKFSFSNPDVSCDVYSLKEPCCSKLKFLAVIIENYKEVKGLLQEILKDLEHSNETVSQIANLLERLKDFEFLFLVVFFNHVFQITNNLYEELIKNSLDANRCHGSVKNACVVLYNHRNESHYNHLRLMATNILNENYSLELIPNTNLHKSYKSLYYEVIDNVIMELHTRFDDTQQYYFLSLGESSLYEHFSPVSKLVQTRFQSLLEYYPNLFNNQTALLNEFQLVYKNQRFWNMPLMKILQCLSEAKTYALQEACKLLSLIALLIPAKESFPCLHKINGYLKNCAPEQRLHIARILMNRQILDSISCRYSFKDDIVNKLSVKCDDIKLSHMVKGKQREATSSVISEKNSSLVVELDPRNVLLNQEPDMVVELDPSAFVAIEDDFSEPGPSNYMEPDSSVTVDESFSMTYIQYSDIKIEPDSPCRSILIKKEPGEKVKQDILSATVEKELFHSFKDSETSSNGKGLLFQPPVLIKEEPVSSEDEEDEL